MMTLIIDDCKGPDEFGIDKCDIATMYKLGLTFLQVNHYDWLYLDYDLEDPNGNGIDVLNWLSEHPEHIPERIICTSYNSIKAKQMQQMVTALDAMRRRNGKA